MFEFSLGIRKRYRLLVARNFRYNLVVNGSNKRWTFNVWTSPSQSRSKSILPFYCWKRGKLKTFFTRGTTIFFGQLQVCVLYKSQPLAHISLEKLVSYCRYLLFYSRTSYGTEECNVLKCQLQSTEKKNSKEQRIITYLQCIGTNFLSYGLKAKMID